MHIFTFYTKDNINNCIHIGASSFLEAVNALTELNNYAKYEYDLINYKVEHIFEEKDWLKILNIESMYLGIPYFISETKYKELIKSKGSLNNTKVTKQKEEPTDSLIIKKIKEVVNNNKRYNGFLIKNDYLKINNKKEAK